MIYSSEKLTREDGSSVVVYWTEPEDSPLRAGVAIISGFCIAAQGKAESMALGLPADGRWEKLLHNLKVRRDELHRNYPFTIEEGVLERIIVEMEGSAPPAAERRPAVVDTGAGSAGGAT